MPLYTTPFHTGRLIARGDLNPRAPFGPGSITWATDATSGKGVPASATDWNAAMAAANISSGGPSGLWSFQQASGNGTDLIGSFTLAAATTPNFNQTITGWTRKGITFDDGSGDGFTNADAGLPDLSSQSQMILLYVRMPVAAPAVARSIISIGGAGSRALARITTTPRWQCDSVAFNTTGVANPCDGAVHPVVLRVNRTAQEQDLFTDVEKVSPTFSIALTGKGLLIGNGGSLAAACSVLYGASFHGAAAELTDAQVKTLLQTLGWTVAW